MPVTIEYDGIDELLEYLGEKRYAGALRKGLLDAGFHVMGQMKAYPPVRRGKQPPKTDRQRRFLHWAFRSGALTLYQRTRTLEYGWVLRFISKYTVYIFNLVPHGPFVQGAISQSFYHKITGWPTDKAVAEREKAKVYQLINASLAKLFRGV